MRGLSHAATLRVLMSFPANKPLDLIGALALGLAVLLFALGFKRGIMDFCIELLQKTNRKGDIWSRLNGTTVLCVQRTMYQLQCIVHKHVHESPLFLLFLQTTCDILCRLTRQPVTQGGVRGRREATGLGVFFGMREVCNMPDVMAKLGLTTGVEGKTVIVQGLGNVGYHSAKFFRENGAIVVSIAEFEGAIFNEAGLNEEEVFQHRKSFTKI